MVNPTKYDDFVQTGVNGTHTLFKCPVAGCVNPTVQVPRADPRQKSSRCFKHNSKYHSKSSNVALVINACCEESRAVRRDATELISDLPARDNPRVRLARDRCIPAWALPTGGLGKAKI